MGRDLRAPLICSLARRRQNGGFKTSREESTRLQNLQANVGGRPKFLFSVIELLLSLRNIVQHELVADVPFFLRTNYPFLLSHLWHACWHVSCGLHGQADNTAKSAVPQTLN